jgi:hypothetical protein
MARKHRFRFGFLMSSPGACTNGRVGVGCSPIRFTAVTCIGALGSVSFGVPQAGTRFQRHEPVNCSSLELYCSGRS